MHLVDLIATLAITQFLYFGMLTGRARMSSGLKAPAMTGDLGFERMYRVQMNTLELLIAFMPALFIAAKYWPPLIAAVLGAIYLIGRFLYHRTYVSNPSKRALGFMLSLAPVAVLLVLSLAGAVRAIFGG